MLGGSFGRTYLVRENIFVVQESLRPVHERIDVVWGGELRWPLVSHTIFPKVLVSEINVAEQVSRLLRAPETREEE